MHFGCSGVRIGCATLFWISSWPYGENNIFGFFGVRHANQRQTKYSINKKDQINMIIKNLLPVYNSRLLSSLISSFGELCDCGKRIEDVINNGQLEIGESKPPTTKTPNLVNVSAIIPQQTQAYLKKARRELSNLGMTLTQAYENLSSKGFIKPLDPTPMPNPIPPTWNLNEFCPYSITIGLLPHIKIGCK